MRFSRFIATVGCIALFSATGCNGEDKSAEVPPQIGGSTQPKVTVASTAVHLTGEPAWKAAFADGPDTATRDKRVAEYIANLYRVLDTAHGQSRTVVGSPATSPANGGGGLPNTSPESGVMSMQWRVDNGTLTVYTSGSYTHSPKLSPTHTSLYALFSHASSLTPNLAQQTNRDACVAGMTTRLLHDKGKLSEGDVVALQQMMKRLHGGSEQSPSKHDELFIQGYNAPKSCDNVTGNQ